MCEDEVDRSVQAGRDSLEVSLRTPARPSSGRGTAPDPRGQSIDVAGLAILVLSVAVGLALVLLATATFIQVVR